VSIQYASKGCGNQLTGRGGPTWIEAVRLQFGPCGVHVGPELRMLHRDGRVTLRHSAVVQQLVARTYCIVRACSGSRAVATDSLECKLREGCTCQWASTRAELYDMKFELQ
jgi:hypothetical protein